MQVACYRSLRVIEGSTEDSLLLHICVQLNKMTDCSRLLSKNGADISFLKSVCTFETAKIHLIYLSKCLFMNIL